MSVRDLPLDLVAARFAAALAHHEAGRIDAARALYRDILALDPDHVESLHLLGLIAAQTGEAEAGASMIMQAIRLFPGSAPHHNSLAVAYRALGRDAEAVAEYRIAVSLRSASAEIHSNLAGVLRTLGQHEAAVAEYRYAARCAPGTAEIWYNLASALADSDPDDDVEACFRRAMDLRPDFVEAIANFGRWLITRARWGEAAKCLADAIRLVPADASSWNNLGVAWRQLGRERDAESAWRRAIALAQDCADAFHNLGCLLSTGGRTDEAVACHAAALDANVLHGAARLAFCMAQIPIVYHNAEEVAQRRANYFAALDGLAAAMETPAIERAVASAVGSSQPFFLSYQGENDREPQALYGRLICRALARTIPTPALAARPARDERIRLGIVSGYFHDHTIFRLFLEGWLSEIDRERFEITGFHTGFVHDQQTVHASRLCGRFVHGPRSAVAWGAAVADSAPHILLYPEVGMDPMAAHLAARRLAPVQCVAWGHPRTTGMPTVDYFLSAELMEPPDGDTHYSESLVRLPEIGVHFTPDDGAAFPLQRAALGLEPDVPVFFCGLALYKYQPEYDRVFPRIAFAVGPCRFLFIGFAKSDAVTRIFQKRLYTAFAAHGLDAGRYCNILPPMPQHRFIATAGLTDVILDTPGWSGGKSTLDCLAGNPAIVTLPGRFMRGRHTAAILRRIGCEQTIARSLDEFVTLAARLALDAAWRMEVRCAVEQGKHRAFRDPAPIRALETFLINAVSRQ